MLSSLCVLYSCHCVYQFPPSLLPYSIPLYRWTTVYCLSLHLLMGFWVVLWVGCGPPPPPNSYVEALTPRTSECECIWRWNLYRRHWDKMKSLIQYDWCTCKDHVKTRRKQPSMSQGKKSQKEPTLLTPWSWTSSLQNCKKINFCCFSHPICSGVLWQLWQADASRSWGKLLWIFVCVF